jgi:aryl-alcohol dehydrogenase-like predicted oxidoreductase
MTLVTGKTELNEEQALTLLERVYNQGINPWDTVCD